MSARLAHARTPGFAPDPARRAMLAKVHLAAKELRLEDDDYRAVLERETGQRSAAKLTVDQLDKVLAAFRRQGWKPKTAAPGKRRAADHPAAGKARALWVSLHQLGVVRDGSERALEAMAERQLGGPLQWADQGKVYKLIEALKKMAERAGWSQDVAGVLPGREADVLLERLVARLRELIREAGGDVPPAWPVHHARRVPQLQREAAHLAERLAAARGRA